MTKMLDVHYIGKEEAVDWKTFRRPRVFMNKHDLDFFVAQLKTVFTLRTFFTEVATVRVIIDGSGGS